MKISTIKIILAVIFILLSMAASIAQQTGRDVMLKVDNRSDGDSRKSIMKMELINKRGSKRVRTMLSYSKDYGKDKKTIMFFQEPADVKGTGFLTWDYHDENRDDDRWLYLPAMKKTRRISGTSAKKEYFMGSDFTYDDLSSSNIDEYDHKLVKEEKLNGESCWVVVSESKLGDDLYAKRKSWVSKEKLMVMRVEYYDDMDKVIKILEVEQVKLIDGYWTSTRLVMNNLQRVHKTIITFESMEYDIELDDNLFTVNSLEKGYIE